MLVKFVMFRVSELYSKLQQNLLNTKNNCYLPRPKENKGKFMPREAEPAVLYFIVIFYYMYIYIVFFFVGIKSVRVSFKDSFTYIKLNSQQE